ncbi:MAG: hypothetical protein ACK559_00800, partial [bacterium]
MEAEAADLEFRDRRDAEREQGDDHGHVPLHFGGICGEQGRVAGERRRGRGSHEPAIEPEPRRCDERGVDGDQRALHAADTADECRHERGIGEREGIARPRRLAVPAAQPLPENAAGSPERQAGEHRLVVGERARNEQASGRDDRHGADDADESEARGRVTADGPGQPVQGPAGAGPDRLAPQPGFEVLGDCGRRLRPADRILFETAQAEPLQ